MPSEIPAPNTLIFLEWLRCQRAVQTSHCFKRPEVLFVSNGTVGCGLRPGRPPPRPSVRYSLELAAHRTQTSSKISISHPCICLGRGRRRDWAVNEGAVRCPETACETNERLFLHYIDHKCLFLSHSCRERGRTVYLLM